MIQRDRRERLEPYVVQLRDVSIVTDVRRYKFLTAPQLREHPVGADPAYTLSRPGPVLMRSGPRPRTIMQRAQSMRRRLIDDYR